MLTSLTMSHALVRRLSISLKTIFFLSLSPRNTCYTLSPIKKQPLNRTVQKKRHTQEE